MRRYQLFLLALILAFITIPPVNGEYKTRRIWTESYGGAGTEDGFSVIEANDGGVIAVGYTDSYGVGDEDIYAVKTSSTGVQQWTKTYGGIGDERANDILLVDDGYLIVGYTDSIGAGGYDIYLVKTDLDGNQLWEKTYGGANRDQGESIIQSTDNTIVIAGVSNGDSFLLKIDDLGNQVWMKTYWGAAITEVVQTTDGGYAFTSNTLIIKTDIDGNVEWGKTPEFPPDHPNENTIQGSATTLIQTADNGFIVGGICEYEILAGPDAGGYGRGYYVKTDSNANYEWGDFCQRNSKVFEIIENSGKYTLAVGPNIFTVNLSGNILWDIDVDGIKSVAYLGNHYYAITGRTSSDLNITRLRVAPVVRSGPTPGSIFYEKGATPTDSFRFYITLRGLNKTRGRSSFTLTITDISENPVYSRECWIRRRTEWYVFYLNKDHFTSGKYRVDAVAPTWNTTKTTKYH